MLLPYLIYNLSDRGDEFSAAEHGNASAYEMRSVQARSRMRISHASLGRICVENSSGSNAVEAYKNHT